MFPVPFDMNRLFLAFEESGFNIKARMWAKSMMKGIVEKRDVSYQCVCLARKLAENDGFTGTVLDEKYWDAAAKELGII